MAEIIMPKMGDAMTEGKVVRWYKQAGDPVKKGEPVLEIETDKVNLDLEAEADGPLGEHKAKEGEMVPVGGVLATIGEAASSASATSASAPAPAAAPAEEVVQRRATDKKDSIKHSTGEYGEAMEMKAPRVDRTAAPSATAAPCRKATAAACARRRWPVVWRATWGSASTRFTAADRAGGWWRAT